MEILRAPARPGVMTPEQCRAGRGWLGWSQLDLARHAIVSQRTLAALERGEQKPQPNNLAAMRRAIEAAGIRLLFDKDRTAAGILREGAEPELSGDVSG
jgi:predicted transcriptional regulator